MHSASVCTCPLRAVINRGFVAVWRLVARRSGLDRGRLGREVHWFHRLNRNAGLLIRAQSRSCAPSVLLPACVR